MPPRFSRNARRFPLGPSPPRIREASPGSTYLPPAAGPLPGAGPVLLLLSLGSRCAHPAAGSGSRAAGRRRRRSSPPCCARPASPPSSKQVQAGRPCPPSQAPGSAALASKLRPPSLEPPGGSTSKVSTSGSAKITNWWKLVQ